MKNSTVNSGNSRSKINSVGVGQPNNRRKSAIVKSIVSPARMPAANPQKIDLTSGRGGEAVEVLINLANDGDQQAARHYTDLSRARLSWERTRSPEHRQDFIDEAQDAQVWLTVNHH